jgi:uncharacterized protein YndB with AHSA1/START domain
MRCVNAITFLLLFAVSTGTIRGEVIDSSAHGFTLKNTVTIAATPNDVYRHLVANIGRWWNPAHTFSGASQNLSIEDKANGCWCEKLEGGGSVRHLVVVYAEPGKTLRLAGALGPLQTMAVAGSMTWSLSKADSGTKVELTYTVGGYRPEGLQSLAPPVDRVLSNQLTRLKNYIETGKPEGAAPKDK